MQQSGRSAMANGNIKPYTPVMVDSTIDNRLIAATSDARCLGIAGKGTRYAPVVWTNGNDLNDGYCAVAGEVFQYWGAGEENVPALLNGTVAAGDRLKADGTGLVTASTPDDCVVAIARMSGAQYDIIQVDVVCAAVQVVS